MIPVITEFLDRFQPHGRGQPLKEDERALVADALESFVLDEQWLGRDPATIDAMSALDRLSSDFQNDAAAWRWPLLATVAAHIVDLAAQLERRDHANLIMREHLIMMFEQIRILKGAQPVGG